MKGKKDQKGSNKKASTPSFLDDKEKKRRSSLTDTPITSSSSSEGMASTDSQPCLSKNTLRKKRKSQKKFEQTDSQQRSHLKSIFPLEDDNLFGKETLPVYTSANSVTTNTTSMVHSVWSSSTLPVSNCEMPVSNCEISVSNCEMPVSNCEMDVFLNNNSMRRTPTVDFTNNEWMKSLKNALIEGNYMIFLAGLRYLCVILCRNNAEFKKYTKDGLLSCVIESLVKSYYDPTHQQTIFMSLCSARTTKCAENGHSFCRLARTLLQRMEPSLASKMLSVATKMQFKTALHCAVMTGDLCQMRVLLKYDIDVDAKDRDNRTPLFYALKNRNLDMVKLLLWYGADFSHAPHFSDKLTIHAEAFESEAFGPKIISSWFQQRTSAITKRFYQFLSEICRGKFIFKADDSLSDLHIMKCSSNMDADNHVNIMQKTDNWLIRSIDINIRENFESTTNSSAILFVVPFCYSPQDQASPADSPCIYRTSLFIETGQRTSRAVQLFPTAPLIQTPDEKVFELTSALQSTHNGHIYAYRMPETLLIKPYTISANFEAEGLSNRQKRTTLLGVQVFRVMNQEFNSKKFN